MKRSISFLITFSLAIIVLVIGLAVLPATAEPQEDGFAYLPFLTSALVPVDFYEDDFNDGIDGWKQVRWSRGVDTDIEWEEGCYEGRCGLMDVSVGSSFAYTIASPLVPGPTRSYVLTFRAKIEDPEDKDQFGAVFSADRDQYTCPGDNTDYCFNQYYELLGRYRDDDGEYFEYRIRRVYAHDDNNTEQFEDLVDWTRVEGVTPDDWTKWEVDFRASGHLYIKVDNKEQPAYARDNHYGEQRYFGLIGRTNEHGNLLVHFDDMKIEKAD